MHKRGLALLLGIDIKERTYMCILNLYIFNGNSKRHP